MIGISKAAIIKVQISGTLSVSSKSTNKVPPIPANPVPDDHPERTNTGKAF